MRNLRCVQFASAHVAAGALCVLGLHLVRAVLLCVGLAADVHRVYGTGARVYA